MLGCDTYKDSGYSLCRESNHDYLDTSMQQFELTVIDTKDVVIGRNRYQISRMSAAVGSWLLFKLIDSLRKIMEGMDTSNTQPEAEDTSMEQKEQAANALIQSMLMTLDQDLFSKVQREALRVCGQYTA